MIYTHKNIDSVSPDIISDIQVFDTEGILSYFNDPFTFDIGIVTNKSGRVVGAGIIRCVNEFKMVIDQNLSNAYKARIVKQLIDKAIQMKQCKEVVVSITLPADPSEREEYRELLETHYGFLRDEGIVLRLEI